MNIITDNKWHQFSYRSDVPINIMVEEFSDLTNEMDGFFNYRGYWYHISDFVAIMDDAGWDGCFSDVVISLNRNGEEYKIGRFL